VAKPATASNQFDPDVVNNLLGKIDGFDSDLESEKGSYMKRCRDLRERIKAVFDEGKALGVPEKELRTLVKIRKNERRNMKLYQELEHDQQETLKMLAATEKVKDLPLWRASFEERGTHVDDTGKMQHAEPMFEDDPQGLANAKFNKLN
jgi:uncharacterized protein (UPF0335 family)